MDILNPEKILAFRDRIIKKINKIDIGIPEMFIRSCCRYFQI